MSSASRFRWCRRARRASGRRCRRRIRPRTSTVRSQAFAEVGRELGVISGEDWIRIEDRMSNMMRALVKAKAEPGIWMEQVPVPEIGPNDVLIKVKKTAICGTDVHIYNWDQWAQKTVPVPMVTGHEFVGTVADFGAAVTEYKVGQRVSGEGHIVCGHCRNCRAGRGHLCRNTLGVGVNRPGSFGEYLAHPAAQCRADPRRHSRRDRRDLRSARQCGAHRAVASTWSARTCWSPAPGRSASWARWSRSASARARSSSPTSTRCGWRSPRSSASSTSSMRRRRSCAT